MPGTTDGAPNGGSIAGEAAAHRGKVREGVRWILLGILGLGLSIRLLHFWALSQTNFLKLNQVKADMWGYWTWAQRILAGDLLGRDTYHPSFEWMQAIAPMETWYRWWGGKEIFHQAPLYPYLVAGLLALSENSVGFVVLAQLVLGGFQPLLTFWLGRRLFDARTGLVAAALTAAYGPLISLQGYLLRDWLIPILNTVALLALLRARDSGRARAWLLAGMALGVSYVAKSTNLLFLPLALLWLGLESQRLWRRRLMAGALVGVGFLLCLSPVVVRNALVGARLFAIETRAAEGFILGNAADGDPVSFFFVPPSMKGILETSEGRLPAVVRETLQTFHGDSSQFLRFQFLKLRGLLNPYEIPNSDNFNYVSEISPVLRFTVGFGLILPLALGGMILGLGGSARQRLLWFYLAAALIGLWLPPIRARYRTVLVPVLLLLGAAFLVWLYESVRSRRILRAVSAASLGLTIALIQHYALALPLPLPRNLDLYSSEHYFAARMYVSEGQLDRAAAEMARLQTWAQNLGAPRVASDASLLEGDWRALRAEQLIREGKQDEARQRVEQAEAAYAGHLSLSAPHYNLGILYLRLGEPAKARAYFARFLELEPSGPQAENLRRLLSQLKGSPR